MDKNESILLENHVFLPARQRHIFDRDFTIREIRCEQCGVTLAALTIDGEHEAKFVWPFRVRCVAGTHVLEPRGADEPSHTVCYGRAALEYEVREFLKPYALPEQKL